MEEVKRELLERVYAAQSHGSPEVLVEACHPDFEWIWPKGMADTDVFHGPEGLRRGIEAWLEPREECRLDPEEMLGRLRGAYGPTRQDGRAGNELDPRGAFTTATLTAASEPHPPTTNGLAASLAVGREGIHGDEREPQRP